MREAGKGVPTTYPDAPRIAVGAVIFHRDRVLLVRRGNPPAKDIWAIPGGGVHLGETLQDAAQREIYEETGVQIQPGEPIYAFDLIERDDQGRVRFHYVIVDLSAEYLSGEPVPGDDAAEVRWVSAQELEDLHVNRNTRKLLKERFDFGKWEEKSIR